MFLYAQVFIMCSAVLFFFHCSYFYSFFINPTCSFCLYFPPASNLCLNPVAFVVCTPSSHIHIHLPDLYYTPAPCYSVIKKTAINNTEMTLIVCCCSEKNVQAIWNGQISIIPAVAHICTHTVTCKC